MIVLLGTVGLCAMPHFEWIVHPSVASPVITETKSSGKIARYILQQLEEISSETWNQKWNYTKP